MCWIKQNGRAYEFKYNAYTIRLMPENGYDERNILVSGCWQYNLWDSKNE